MQELILSVEFISADRSKDTEYLGEERFTGTRFSQLAQAIAMHVLAKERNYIGVSFSVVSYKRGATLYEGRSSTGQLQGITEVLTLLVMQALKR